MEKLITEGNRVRKNTSPMANLKIDEQTRENILRFSGQGEEAIAYRIKQLDAEWDIERVLETNMSAIALAGITLSVFVSRKWLVLPAVVLGFFAQHALQGWCPPVKLFRALKVRTRDEIDQERHALKALRGDYHRVRSAGEAFIASRRS